ncbi:MAG: hypothetical protein DWQ44_01095 [Bacteroidetes bacterium]|nr:MAG: hypothetical protein DWQ33_00560 [Bacteroidota bacterium]REK04986.1 MAG: hypothetical protein DWQ39_07160 [Bacteroidota bacterium]REK36510.1 MAG: hypothetical protein DWQ44_01095 [Bacteroidota bacterium]REK51723.1 MAG: hypothetical protein DWQ48_00840 [Bacteroidota bacterium]
MKIKSFLCLSIYIILCPRTLLGQDLIDAYAYRQHLQISQLPVFTSPAGHGFPAFTFDYALSTPLPYTGEYMININHLPYMNTQSIAGAMFNNSIHNYNPNDFFKSYEIEVVSFPFSIDCAFTNPISCANNSNQRNFEMPQINSYNPDPDITSWEYTSCNGPSCRLRNKLSKGFDQYGFAHRTATTADPAVSQALVSVSFKDNGPALNERDLLPHSVLKHTIRFHCGDDINSQVISEVSFIYDHTRGLMRY